MLIYSLNHRSLFSRAKLRIDIFDECLTRSVSRSGSPVAHADKSYKINPAAKLERVKLNSMV